MAAALTERGLSKLQFAALIGAKKSSLTMWLQGKRKPPWRAWAKWADALALAGDKRERLMMLMLMPHCPPPVRECLSEKLRRGPL